MTITKECVILCGLPASGKTFRREQLIEEAEYYKRSYFVYTTDDLLEDLAQQIGCSYAEMFRVNIKWATEQLNEKLEKALEENVELIIWDQTNLTLKKRNKIRSLLAPHGYSFTVDCILSPVGTVRYMDIWNRRLLDRKGKKDLSHDVLERMKESYEIPTVETDGPNIIWSGIEP